PKTGETNVMMWAGMVAVAALAGMAVTYRRRKDA
ncbi:LPXTG cell wall anchor domain-containing protein, partial [Blautia sp.]